VTYYNKLFDGISRDALEQAARGALDRCETLEGKLQEQLDVNSRLLRDMRQLHENLTFVQKRCTALLQDNRDLRAGLVLPGWNCTRCGAFTGTAKEDRRECRCCGAPR